MELLLDETLLAKLPIEKRTCFMLDWLIRLDQLLEEFEPSQVKVYQKQLVDQLIKQIHSSPGPPARKLIGRALANLFSIGDPFLLFDTVNTCNEILKNKDDSPSFLPTKLAAITCIGSMYEKLGRLMGRSYEDTVTLLLRSLKNAESQLRCEIFNTLRKILNGMSTAASALHRDVFKAIKHGLPDRVPLVRCNAAKCLEEMINHAPFLYTSEIESVFSLCFRSLEHSNYEVRRSVSKVIGHLVAITQQSATTGGPSSSSSSSSAMKLNRMPPSLDDVMALLASGFVKGGLGGFLKTAPSEMIKGPASVSKEIRVGISYAYIEIVDQLGDSWFERHFSIFVQHLLDLLINLKTNTTHMDAVFSRRCVFFVLHSLCKRLSERAQLNAIKVFASILSKTKVDHQPVDQSDSSNITSTSIVAQADLHQHVLICILLKMGCIFDDLGTCATNLLNDNSLKLVETLLALLVYPVHSVRVAAAWCLRCMAKACPSQLTCLIDGCVEKLEQNKSSVDVIGGHSLVLSALIGVADQTPLGIPHNRGKIVFCIAEDLLRSATQNSRLSLARTQAGWQLIGSVMTLGPSVVRGLLPRVLLIWKNSFARNAKDLESEKARGDAFTWQMTLENRAGALAAMATFLEFNPSLACDETISRMMSPIESAILMLNTLNLLFKSLGPVVKASAACVRLRLYETLLQLSPNTFETSFTSLLRLLVAEFTLAENVSNTASSLLPSFCHTDDHVLLGSWSQETDQRFIEDQLQASNANSSGALEHDLSCLYRRLDPNQLIPSQLPLGVSVVNRSCQVFAHSFRIVASKHRLQMLNHFQECIKHAKVSRQEAIQINTLTTLIGSLKSLADHKLALGGDEIQRTCLSLLLPLLSHQSPLIRCASAHALGRLCQVLGDGRFVAELASNCFDKLKSARDMLSRTGHSLAIGYLHRFMGSLGSQTNLSSGISILLALSQDLNSPVVQVWSLHALSLIVDSGGPMFRPYIEITLQHALKLLTTAPYIHSDVHQCSGRLLSALITTIGPELQEETELILNTRKQLLLASLLMQTHPDELVQVQAINCLQQLHMFAAGQISLARLVPALCCVLCSEQLLLRSAAIGCLYQLSQREAGQVCAQASDWVRRNQPALAEHALPGLLFDRLDKEQQPKLKVQLQNVLVGLLQSLCQKRLNRVLLLCKEVLTNAEHGQLTNTTADLETEADEDDEIGFQDSSQTISHLPRWSTKVFAAQMLCRVVRFCENSSHARIHFDLAAARQATATVSRRQSIPFQTSDNGVKDGSRVDETVFEEEDQKEEKANYLILHLSELIRMAFMAATSDSDPLRLEGLQLLELIIEKFARVPEPEFNDHVVLEQYQAQVGAALRPAFAADTASHVTAMACQVCSAWIGSGVARDLNDLHRVHQLLVSSLHKLKRDSSCRLYNESASTMEKLAILKAWAEVYIVAMRLPRMDCTRFSMIRQHLFNQSRPLSEEERLVFEGQLADNENLLQLVRPELPGLSQCWLDALKDHALLTLPSEFDGQLPHDGGAFYTPEIVDVARPLYRKSWPSILHAACLWLCSIGFDEQSDEESAVVQEKHRKQFHLLLGISMEALCNPKSSDPLVYIITCLKSLETLLSHDFTQRLLGQDQQMSIELCSVLHRLLITRETLDCQQIILSIAHLVCLAQLDQMELVSTADTVSIKEDIGDISNESDSSSDDLQPGKSICYNLAEIVLCVLIRQLPELSSSLANTPGLNCFPSLSNSQRRSPDSSFLSPVDEQHIRLIGSAVILLSKLPSLCSPKSSPTILPTVLYLLTGVFRHARRLSGFGSDLSSTLVLTEETMEVCRNNRKIWPLVHEREPMLSLFVAFGHLVSSPLAKHLDCEEVWLQLLRSCLSNILDMCKSSDEEPRPDCISVLFLISIFVLQAPPEVIQPANLQFPCINLLKHSMEDSNEIVQLKTFEVLKRILAHYDQPPVIPFIHSLAPSIVQIVNNEIDVSNRTNITKSKYNLIMIGLEILETLARGAQKNYNLLLLYIPLLMKLLVDDLSQAKTRPFSVLLHNFALQKLITIGPVYPQEFKQIVAQVPAYKQRLETAIRHNQQQCSPGLKSDHHHHVGVDSSVGASMIKLKTDFSNFA